MSACWVLQQQQMCFARPQLRLDIHIHMKRCVWDCFGGQGHSAQPWDSRAIQHKHYPRVMVPFLTILQGHACCMTKGCREPHTHCTGSRHNCIEPLSSWRC